MRFPEASSNDRILPQAVGASEIANRFLKHDFRVRNSTLLWELSSIGRSPIKSLESRRI